MNDDFKKYIDNLVTIRTLKILEAANKLNEKQLEKVTEELKESLIVDLVEFNSTKEPIIGPHGPHGPDGRRRRCRRCPHADRTPCRNRRRAAPGGFRV